MTMAATQDRACSTSLMNKGDEALKRLATAAICRFCCTSRHTDGAGRLMPFVEAVRCHPLDCAGRLTLDFTDACNVTQRTQGRVVVAGRPTWQACEGSAQSLPT